MSTTSQQLKEFHWLMDLLQTIEVGLVVLDRNANISVWNSFMENHSGLLPRDTNGKNIFDLFPEIPKVWFKHKLESVFLLKNRAFSTWEQRPFVFPFKNYRPITGTAEYMYQNLTINPLLSTTGEVEHVSVVVYDVTDIATNKQDLKSVNIELEHLSKTDRLTALLNRGSWEEELSDEFVRYQRYQQPISLVMFDIDHFKTVNDTYGHPAGDAVIRKVAEVTRHCARNTDICGRYGGEEFTVILPNTSSSSSKLFCERVRTSLEKITVVHQTEQIKFTVSLGISELTNDMRTYKEWLEAADKALYHAKENGRNRTSVFDVDLSG